MNTYDENEMQTYLAEQVCEVLNEPQHPRKRHMGMVAQAVVLSVSLVVLLTLVLIRALANNTQAPTHEMPAPVYSTAELLARLAVAPDVAAHEPQTPEPVAEPEPEPRYEEITAEERELLAAWCMPRAIPRRLRGRSRWPRWCSTACAPRASRTR